MYEILNEIAGMTGINDKKDRLRYHSENYPMLKKLINYTYNPYSNYYMRKFPMTSTGTTALGEEVFKILDMFNNRIVTGDRARAQYIAYASLLNKESQILFKRILLGDLRMGLNIKSFNSIWPGLIPVHDVMLAQKIDWNRIKFPCWSSVKIDGVRAIYKNYNFLTRSGKRIYGLEHLIGQLGNAPEIDGELFIPGSGFDYSCGNIRSLHASPNAVFGMFEAPDSAVCFEQRLEFLKSFRTKHTRIVKHKLVRSVEEALAFNAKCWAAGFEGTVLKPYDYRYVRKRSFDWMKIKENNTEDLMAIGKYEGTGRNESRLGGIIVLRDGKEVRVGGGYSDDQREEIWENFDREYVNMYAEVNFQEVTKDGSLRHPNFVRWRPDL